jgi:hypothetical protein
MEMEMGMQRLEELVVEMGLCPQKRLQRYPQNLLDPN